jgi:serine/threonine-protein kinase HipA
MYEEFDQEMAMASGDEFDLEKIAAYDLKCFAQEIGVPIKLLSLEIIKMCKKMKTLLGQDFIEMEELSKIENSFINDLKNKILQRIKHFEEHAILMLQL